MFSGPTETLHERQVIFRPLKVTNYKNITLTPYIFGYTPDVKAPQNECEPQLQQTADRNAEKGPTDKLTTDLISLRGSNITTTVRVHTGTSRYRLPTCPTMSFPTLDMCPNHRPHRREHRLPSWRLLPRPQCLSSQTKTLCPRWSWPLPLLWMSIHRHLHVQRSHFRSLWTRRYQRQLRSARHRSQHWSL